MNDMTWPIFLYNISTSSKNQTKLWRKAQSWYKNGKHNECEKFQRNFLRAGLRRDIPPTTIRLDTIDNKLTSINNPLASRGGFKYSEDFDAAWKELDIFHLVNLKFICSSGGSQNRTLRELFHFILSQHLYLLNNQNTNIKFINIIDGDQGYKYVYENRIKNKASLTDIQLDKRFVNIIDRIYIGDMKNFWIWYNNVH